MSMIDHLLIHPATIYKQTKNEYGDLIDTDATEANCWFREITTLERTRDYEQETAPDSLARFAPSVDVAEGDIIDVDGGMYRVMKLTKARKMDSTVIEFLRCELQKQGDLLVS